MKASDFANFFKIEDKPVILSKGQNDIFRTIIKREHPRNNVICPTQYGKSLTVALAVTLRFLFRNEKWALIAPSEKKAKVIMNYIIEHCFDDPFFYNQLEITEPLERLKRERSKLRLTSKCGGEVFLVTADARNRQAVKSSLMGFGAQNVIEDEAALIPDDLHSTVMRMLGGHKDNFLLKISNPWNRGHFFRSWHNDKYHNIFIDYKQAVEEGRFSQDFIDEMKGEAFFSILYGCKFPEADEIDAEGWRILLTDIAVENAFVDDAEFGENKKLGVDVGRGGDYTTYVLRDDKSMKLLEKNQSNDLMEIVGRIIHYKNELGLENSNIFVDDIGVGGGVSDRLEEQGFGITPVKVGEKALDEKFANKKAENYWHFKEWIDNGGKIVRNSDWMELTQVKYKENSSGKLQMEPKERLFRRGEHSPDIAEGGMLTFSQTIEPRVRFI